LGLVIVISAIILIGIIKIKVHCDKQCRILRSLKRIKRRIKRGKFKSIKLMGKLINKKQFKKLYKKQ